MVKHIVFFKLQGDSDNKNDGIQTLKDKLDKLKNKIPQIINLETGINISTRSSAYDLALVTEFKNEGDLEIYRNHPEHQDIITYIREAKIVSVVTDYIIG